jgi:hypothetical protein
MRERVALCGGEFSAGPVVAGPVLAGSVVAGSVPASVLAGSGASKGFRVYARFPLPEAAPSEATPAAAPSKLIPAATPPPADVPLSRSVP